MRYKKKIRLNGTPRSRACNFEITLGMQKNVLAHKGRLNHSEVHKKLQWMETNRTVSKNAKVKIHA